MNVSNLRFFDKNGEAYNFELVTVGSSQYWYGADYFLPVSTALYDVSNIFILEKTNNEHHFPNLGVNGTLTIKWKSLKDVNNFFLFTITPPTATDDNSYLTKLTEQVVSESDFGSNFNFSNLKYPLQVNVAFTPDTERAYDRVLELYWDDGSNTVKILELGFYGEGEDEDERFRVWLNNFGIKFNREDAEILKNYDLKEGLPDWKEVNLARKEILVNRDQIYPYVGTYKGLINLVNILGYRDVLKVKEYWQNVEANSPYYKKFAQVDITDMMDDGIIQNLDLVNRNAQIKKGEKFVKTEFLALVYQFSQPSGQYDDDGLPEVEFTTEFTVNEIFYKLNKMSEKLKNEILPINVVIKDIIGEFIYFEKFNLRYWPDRTDIIETQINEEFTAEVLYPNIKSQELIIRDIKSLFPKENLTSAFPFVTFNISQIHPYSNNQLYDPAQAQNFIQAIQNYYTHEKAYEYTYHGDDNPFKIGDDAHGQSGCPIVLLANIDELTLSDLDGSTFDEFRVSKSFVRVATTTNITLSGLQEVDGVQVNIGDRVLVKEQTNPIQNGIWIASDATWARTTEFTTYVNSLGAIAFVDEGDTLTGTGWYTVDNLLEQGGIIPISFGQYTAESADSMKSHHTIGTLKYRDSFETEWTITGPNNYYYNVRGTTVNYAKWPHILPYVGDYTVTLKMYDLSAGISVDNLYITVDGEEPMLTVFTRLEDKFSYTFSNLDNVMIQDFGSSSIYNAAVNVVDPDPGSILLDLNHFNLFTYLNNFGLGSSVSRIEIYNGSEYEPITTSTLPTAKQWGLGLSDGRLTLGDLGNVRLGSMYHTRLGQAVYPVDYLNGFSIDPIGLISMQYGNFPAITVPPQYSSNINQFANYMNQVPFVGWSDYTYQVIGSQVKASAKRIDRKNHAILTFTFPSSVTVTKYTFSFPTKVYSESVVSWLETQFPQVDRDLLFLDVPFDDLIQGLGGTTQYWIDRGFIQYSTTTQTGFLPSSYDQNAFDFIGLKVSDDTIKVPLQLPVFAVVNNIDSKTETIWTLRKDSVEIAKIKSTSYFTWRFNEPGKYTVDVTSQDSFGNSFSTTKPIMFVEVLPKESYAEYVENTLNRRKLDLSR
jgi:hypothetical protein